LSPIRIKANPDSAVIRFDEVVLIEPGGVGSRLGDKNFYDYVVVEGSSDNGSTWRPLLDAYSSADNPDWLKAYTSGVVVSPVGEQNSTMVGVPALYRHRNIPLLNQKSLFRAGDQILIRFRLLADQLSHGWGWAIDNLRIQAPAAPLVLANEPTTNGTMLVYPNPVTSGIVQLKADLTTSVTSVQLSIAGSGGQLLRQLTVPVKNKVINQQLDLSQLPSGLYFLHLTIGDSILIKKIVLSK
ncbi:MAG: T9SS type A sorting domain-containing protein, partial [Cytophagaceae bacterium]